MKSPLEQNIQELQTIVDRDWRMLIGGELVSADDGATMPVLAPFDGRHLADVPLASPADIDKAVRAAQAAYPAWRNTPLTERIRVIRAFGKEVASRARTLGLLDAGSVGNALEPMMRDAEFTALELEYQCGVAFEVKGSTLPSMSRSWLMTRREPYGVVGRIVAYNHPLLFAGMKLGPPLLMGNTLILKTPDQGPLSGLFAAELACDLFPPGVLNIVSGTGGLSGDALVRHPDVKRLSVIGSVETGQRIQAAAATAGVKHVSMELGGKNPMVVCPDADLDAAIEGAAMGMNTQFQGQSCGSTTRLFLHEDIHDEFVGRLVERVRKIRLGHPLDPESEMGCLVSGQHLRRVLSYIESGKEEGAHLATGGVTSDDPLLRDGPFLEPTVFTDVEMSMKIAREEIFGPVLSVLRWRTMEEVVEQANSVRYGLTGAVWTRDLQLALSMADQLDTGYVWINGTSSHFLGAPFSGHKDSGTDSEEGIDELVSYTQLKTVNIAVR